MQSLRRNQLLRRRDGKGRGKKNPYQLTGLTVHFSRRSRIASDAATFSPGEVRQREKGGEVRGGEGRRQERRREGRGERVHHTSVC